MRRPSRAVVAALVMMSLAGAACGIPTGGSPTAIARSDVPFHILNPEAASTPTTTSPTVGVPETIFLVAPSQRVAPVTRVVAVPATLSDILGALLQGPTAAESAAGLQSFLTGTKTQVSATVAGGIATVNFSANPVLAQVVGPDQTLAIAQVVFTATQPGTGVIGVTFEIDGTPVAVPTSGAQVLGPVGPNAYLPYAPAP
jgi:spore germination protein GerM